jgi:uncharacterized protein YdaU (DUF1376 family)
MAAQGWFHFYPSDFLGDAKLRICSLEAQGLWIMLLCLMHDNERRGYLTLGGKPMTVVEIARAVGRTTSECSPLLAELETAAVFSREADGTIYSRRMVRDTEVSKARSNAGKAGGERSSSKRQANAQAKGQANGVANASDLLKQNAKQTVASGAGFGIGSESEEGVGETGDPVYVMLADAGFKPTNALNMAAHPNATPERVRWLIDEASKARGRLKDPIAFIAAGIRSGSVPQQPSDFKPTTPKSTAIPMLMGKKWEC